MAEWCRVGDVMLNVKSKMDHHFTMILGGWEDEGRERGGRAGVEASILKRVELHHAVPLKLSTISSSS